LDQWPILPYAPAPLVTPGRLLTSCIAAALLLVPAGCGGGDDEGGAASGVTAISSDACGEVEYGGGGEADALIVSDLPLQGDSSERSAQMNDAVRLVLEGADWRAGDRRVAFQACDDSIASTGLWDEARCRANARAYSRDRDVIGVIGTYNSGCAEAMVPILNRAPGGGLAMVSPGNTLICLTEPSPSCSNGEPASLYPSQRRNYARVVPNDAFQGAGLASYAHRTGTRRVSILYAADDPTSLGQAETFRGAAEQLGIDLAGFRSWDPEADSFTDVMQKVKADQADSVLLAGLIEQGGARLIKDKVSVLGPNSGPVRLFAPDGFAQQSTIDQAGSASAGMFVSVPGLVPGRLTGEGKRLVDDLKAKESGKPVELYAPYAGQAANVLLEAIGKSAARSGVIAAVFQTNVRGGITGSFSIEPSGDPSVGPITVSVAKKSFEPRGVIVPPPALVAAARRG
jgi:branched-chain amino acid transport system substrate-binding protein